jgi:hypothetical protein
MNANHAFNWPRDRDDILAGKGMGGNPRHELTPRIA